MEDGMHVCLCFHKFPYFRLKRWDTDAIWMCTLQWRHNGRDRVSNHQPRNCLLNGLFRRRSKKTSKLRVTGLCAGNSPGTGEFPAQVASDAENVSTWWRHHDPNFNVMCSSTVRPFGNNGLFRDWLINLFQVCCSNYWLVLLQHTICS